MERSVTLGKAARGAIAAALMIFAATAANAQMEAPEGVWTLTGFAIRTYWWGLVPSGGDFATLYNGMRILPGLDTILENDLGAGYETDNFYTNPDGSPYWGPSDGSAVLFDRLQILEGLGIRQGILWDTERNRNLVEGFLFYRLHYDRNYPGAGALVSASAFPDRNQILSNSFQAGVSASTLDKDQVHKTWDGLYGEASVQWAPSFFFNSIGGANFYRLNLTLKGFRTLYAAPAKGESNFFSLYIFSLYVGDFISVDYAGGDSIPFYVLESTGGLKPRATTDDWVRGFETGSYGTTFKAVNNFDIRIQGPAVIWPSVVPGLYAFTDAGYYSGFYQDPTNTPGGLLVSVGAGAYLDFFDLTNLTGYIAFPVSGHRVDGARYEISFHFNL
ncbi:MAG TPA: hypothetical protein VMU36_11410, partial [Spirochaetia bacterium]|nr:hypothetical protein [Spirochaetia bacterium]